jgi:chromate transporter
MNNPPNLLELGFYFAALSLVSIGGANGVIPDMHRHFVEMQYWMSDAVFVELVALAQAAPGPNVLVVTLLGWKVAGFAGAMVATVGMCVPSSLLSYGAGQLWDRYRHTRWHTALRHGLAPITVGLIVASGYVLTAIADDNWLEYAITAATVAAVLTTQINPLWLLGVAGVIGYAIQLY